MGRILVVRAIALVVTLTLGASACGGGDSTDAAVTLRTAGDIAADASSVTSPSPTTVAPAAAGASETDQAAVTETSTSTTLPQQEQTPAEEFFEAVGIFTSCLDADGYEFMGLPDEAAGPDAPQNAPAYLTALQQCATRSDILNKMQAADDARGEFSPEEIETQNRGYLQFRDCMVGRGWGIPEPTPNEDGLLFAGFQQATTWTAPDGETISSTDDTSECLAAVDVAPADG